MKIPLLSGSAEGISTNATSQRAVNMYWEPPPKGQPGEGSYLPVHGATLFDTLANTGDIRGMLFDPGDSLLYVVSDNDLYSVTSGAVETARDVLATTSGRVEMALNPISREIVTVDGNTGYHYAISTTTATDISDVDFPDTATTVAYINGRFLVNNPTTAGLFAWSNLNNGTAWDAADTGTAQSLESPIRKILVDKGDIFLFGDKRSEVFYNTGSTAVFERFEWIETGIAAAATAVRFDNSVAWLAQDENGNLTAVRAGSGYRPEVFSNQQIAYKWSTYSTVSDAFAYVYQMNGHEFYVITFPTAARTWGYDASTQMWHERGASLSGWNLAREKANAHAFCTNWSNGTHIVGDFNETGKLFALSPTVFTFDSTAMPRMLIGPLIASENEERLRISEVQVDIEEGVAESGDSNKTLTLYWSKDGGHNYSSGAARNLGEAAVEGYSHRLMWRKLGKGRLWNFRLFSNTERKLIVKGMWARTYGESKGPLSERDQ